MMLCYAPALAASPARIGGTPVASLPVRSAGDSKQQRQAHSKTRHAAAPCAPRSSWQRFCARRNHAVPAQCTRIARAPRSARLRVRSTAATELRPATASAKRAAVRAAGPRQTPWRRATVHAKAQEGALSLCFLPEGLRRTAYVSSRIDRDPPKAVPASSSARAAASRSPAACAAACAAPWRALRLAQRSRSLPPPHSAPRWARRSLRAWRAPRRCMPRCCRARRASPWAATCLPTASPRSSPTRRASARAAPAAWSRAVACADVVACGVRRCWLRCRLAACTGG